MSTHLSPENEAYLTDLVARREFADRDAALDEAVSLLRRRREIHDAVNAGVAQLDAGQVHRYEADEIERFRADVEAREKLRFPAK